MGSIRYRHAIDKSSMSKARGLDPAGIVTLMGLLLPGNLVSPATLPSAAMGRDHSSTLFSGLNILNFPSPSLAQKWPPKMHQLFWPEIIFK